jgi:hypothetical protein
MRIFWPFARLDALLAVNGQMSAQFFVEIRGSASTPKQVAADPS